MRFEIEINDILARDITTTVVNALAATERTSRETYSTQSIFEKLLSSLPDIISLIKAAKQPERKPETRADLIRLCPKTAVSIVFDYFKNRLTPEQMEQLNTWIETNAKSGEKSEPEDKNEDTPAPAKEE